MPRMTGLELLKAIRKDQALKDVPFIMVTAEGQRENVLYAVQEGVNNYVIKPFTPEVLAKKIMKVFKQ